MRTRLAPVHPGEVLREEFLSPMQISQYRLAKDIAVDPRRVISVRCNHAPQRLQSHSRFDLLISASGWHVLSATSGSYLPRSDYRRHESAAGRAEHRCLKKATR